LDGPDVNHTRKGTLYPDLGNAEGMEGGKWDQGGKNRNRGVLKVRCPEGPMEKGDNETNKGKTKMRHLFMLARKKG